MNQASGVLSLRLLVALSISAVCCGKLYAQDTTRVRNDSLAAVDTRDRAVEFRFLHGCSPADIFIPRTYRIPLMVLCAVRHTGRWLDG